MNKKYLLAIASSIFSLVSVFAQKSTSIEGHISSAGERLPFVDVTIESLGIGVVTNEDGRYHFELSPGSYDVRVSYIGYKSEIKKIDLKDGQNLHLDFDLKQDIFGLDQVVVTSTRNAVSRKESPVTVNVLSDRIFEITQASTMSQGLSFTPGLRVDLSCQNCGLPDVKMNGLAGAYSQVLIDGRPLYSALSGVYGLEQIPANMIERIEIVKGGGSALYGANAIAGTINVITKDPTENTFTIAGNTNLIGGKTSDNTINFNSSIVTDDYNSGVSFFGSYRDRGGYDANNDGFTELSKIKTYSFGAKAYYKPSNLSRVGAELHLINDFRRGGNMLDELPHKTDVTEQTDHDIVSGQLSYEAYNKSMKDKLSGYISFQTTSRSSYDTDIQLMASNYYGNSDDITVAGGLQYSHLFNNSTLTTGFEARHNNVVDRMPGYNRLIDQTVNSLGTYLQYEFIPVDNTTILLGGRFDYTPIKGRYDFDVIVDESKTEMKVFTPRISLMYDISHDDQIRFTFAQGFRPPQAFDEDLHIETIGGSAKIVRISDVLQPERSNSFTLGYEHSENIGISSVSVTADLFYTKLNNPFLNVAVFDNNDFPDNIVLVEKRNGNGAAVMGSNLEVNTYVNKKLNFQLGATFQRSEYENEQIVLEGNDDFGEPVEISTRQMLRSPNQYGYLTLQYLPFERLSTNITAIYTGTMLIANQTHIELRKTPSFFEAGVKISYVLPVNNSQKLEISSGVQNLFNSYQSDFESGAERDSGYIYGPMQPRTIYAGIKLGIF